MKTREMKRSWLIQRLEKPRNYGQLKDNPFSFGGGLKNGGLNEEVMDLLRPVFSFDYMGAAEFEFGAVPKALQKMASDADKFVAFSFAVPLSKVEADWRDKSEVPSGDGRIYVLCNDQDVDEVLKRINVWAVNRYNSDLKETTRLASTLRPNSEWDGKVTGWLELDNGFFFFTDKVMWERTAELFGIKTD